MRVRIEWMAVVAVALFGLVLTTGCELSESCDPATDPNCEVADAGTDGTTTPDGSSQYQSYYYVLVRDLEDSEPNSYGTNGSEIDGIALFHGGSANYADYVNAIGFGTGETDYTDQNQVLGAPEGGDDRICDTDNPHFVSLGGTGGTGGYVIVSFFTSVGDLQEIVNGDTVRIYECGDTVEEYNAFVGVGTSVSDPNWHPCGGRMSGIGECTVSSLPQVPIN